MWPFSSKKYVAEAQTRGFISSAELTKGSEGDLSHTLTVHFKEPVRDGNRVSHFNILFNGRAIASDNLFTGETTYSAGLTPTEGVYTFVFADEDKTVLITDEVSVRQEP